MYMRHALWNLVMEVWLLPGCCIDKRATGVPIGSRVSHNSSFEVNGTLNVVNIKDPGAALPEV